MLQNDPDRILLFTLMRIRIMDSTFHFDADPDSAFRNDANPLGSATQR
jgi:hypothetical protein